jgi:ATP-dependent Clp protease ATP-binding subunit ClpA
LKRVLQRELETTLGRKLLEGSISDSSVVAVDIEGDKLSFRSRPLAEAA